MSKIVRYRDCSIGDVINVTGACTITIENKSGRAPRVKIETDQDNEVSFSTGERAHTCCDTTNSLTKGD